MLVDLITRFALPRFAENGREQEAERTANGSATGYCNDKDKVPALVHYPDNLHPVDLFYFLLAPTLCYELNFPKTNRIRKRFLIKRMLEVVIGVHIVMGLFQQWMIPSVRNSLVPFSNMDLTKTAERLLKLAVSEGVKVVCLRRLTAPRFDLSDRFQTI